MIAQSNALTLAWPWLGLYMLHIVQSPAGRGLVVNPVRVNKFPSKDKLLHFLQVHSSKDE